jgi:DNA (cytosine-5)-methyltransferase 1
VSLGEIRALDLFAGTGWGVALQARGIREGGVDNMPEVRATRAAAGMETIYEDVWDGLLGDDPVRFWHALQIASPPCQSFSLAGKGAGRAALDDVLRAIDDGAYRRPERLRALGAETDDRTALVLTPLAHVFRDRPLWVTWEQVPPVLPVWEACAEVLRGMGYSVWVGIIRAEQYGVPQTRRRAVLIARADGIEAAAPTPTHSRYYEREPQRLDEGVLPWVSMAEAIGEHGTSTLRSNYGTGGDASRRGERLVTQPAPTITSKAGRNKWDGRRPMWVVEAAALQTYPRGFVFAGTAGAQFLQIGNAVPPLMAGAIIDELLAPAALRVVPEAVAA